MIGLLAICFSFETVQFICPVADGLAFYWHLIFGVLYILKEYSCDSFFSFQFCRFFFFFYSLQKLVNLVSFCNSSYECMIYWRPFQKVLNSAFLGRQFPCSLSSFGNSGLTSRSHSRVGLFLFNCSVSSFQAASYCHCYDSTGYLKSGIMLSLALLWIALANCASK